MARKPDTPRWPTGKPLDRPLPDIDRPSIIPTRRDDDEVSSPAEEIDEPRIGSGSDPIGDRPKPGGD